MDPVPTRMSTPLARRLVARLPRRTVRFRLTLLYGGLFLAAGAAVLAFAVGWFVAGRVLRPLRAMTSTA
jgi:hypothetical protein